ncbi:MAG: PucR family transcriptional regulator [Phototrophicaceae bacterium]
MVSVSTLLELPVFKGYRIAAGEHGLNRPVRWVHIVAMPESDDYQWTKGGEIILSVAYGLQENTERQSRIIPIMAESKIAALVISMGHYLQEIPPVMVEEANRLNFPIIEVPGDTLFVDITKAIFGTLESKQSAIQRQMRVIHETLTRVVLDGGKIQDVAEIIASFLNKSVTIESATFEVLAHARRGTIDSARRKSIESGRTSPEVTNTLHNSGLYKQLLIERESKQLDPIPEIGLELERIVAPIIVSNTIIGYMWVIAHHADLTELDHLVLEQAATTAALIIYKDRAIYENMLALRGDFFNLLLQPNQVPQTWLESQAIAFDFQLERQYQVLLFSSRKATPEDLTQLLNSIDSQLRSVAKALIVSREQQVVVVLQTRNVPNGKQIAHTLHSFLQLQEHIPPDLIIGIGNAVKSYVEIINSYEQAKEAITIAERLEILGMIEFSELGLFHWLQQLSNQVLEQNIFYMAIAKLAEFDQKHNKQLLPTLEIFLQCGGSIKEASEILFVHRNTLLYRLDRIETFTNVQLKNPDNRLNLSVALKAFRLRGNLS